MYGLTWAFSTFVVFKNPVDVFWTLMDHVGAWALIVGRLNLLSGWREHWQNTHADTAGLESGSPVWVKGAQTDVPTRIYVFMYWRSTFEHHLWRFEWILISEPELQSKHFSIVQAVLRSFERDVPDQFYLVYNLELEHIGEVFLQIDLLFIEPLK